METPHFENVKTKDSSLPGQVADQITQLIIERHLSSEDKLPNEFELAAQLNVGRGTIREAVKLLVARNVLVIRHGKGTFIASNPGQIEDPLGFSFYPDQIELAFDLLEIREQMEPWVAALAAKQATKEDLKILQETCKRVEEDILAGRNHLPNDKLFHTSIAQCTQNKAVPKLIPIITYAVGLFGYLNGNVLLSETIVDHRAIVEAICNHNPEAAAEEMRKHMKHNRVELELIKKESEKKGEKECGNNKNV